MKLFKPKASRLVTLGTGRKESASRAGSQSTLSSRCRSAEREKSSGPSPQPPSWARLGYPGCTMSSAVTAGRRGPEEGGGPAARAWPRALCRLGTDMFWPMVVSPRYTSGHLWTREAVRTRRRRSIRNDGRERHRLH
ncbi:hypothetical protein EYF80_030084 [Liparis tanakae]|uniref:Uncharacterized protein n=1 Tax=Liparis tanakae TaxID=230148 RepID=A0A4Z2H3N9_9TELE|nr:hypothetical protein EYF80_030084 [Liparis tanakae]